VPQDSLPPDPFAGDPDDPTRSLDSLPAEDELEPLTAEEREEIVEDLSDLAIYQALLENRGVRGLVVDCAQLRGGAAGRSRTARHGATCRGYSRERTRPENLGR
jgi:hypothetical protein